MNRDEFWSIIEGARSDGDQYEHSEAVQAALCKRSAEDILDFERHLKSLFRSSHTLDLWGAANVVSRGCSEDGFDFFRGWLILQGRAVFEKVVADPDSLADVPGLEKDVECEDILAVGFFAYEAVTGKQLPGEPYESIDLGEEWDFFDRAEMERRYPKLYKKLFRR